MVSFPTPPGPIKHKIALIMAYHLQSRDAPVARHGRVLRHAGGDAVRLVVYAGVLCRGALDRTARAAAYDSAGSGPAAAALSSESDFAHAEAAADVENLAGDEAGVLAEEERDCGGHLLGPADPADRDLPNDGLGRWCVRRIVGVEHLCRDR